MTRTHWMACIVCFLVAVAWTPNTGAEIISFYGVDNTGGGGAGEHPIADAARSEFLGDLASYETEDFEGFALPANGTYQIPSTGESLSFPGHGTGMLYPSSGVTSSDVQIENRDAHPTSGNHILGAQDAFHLTFDSPQDAFGFYAIDVFDDGARLSLQLTHAGGETTLLDFMADEDPLGGRSVLYFGFHAGTPEDRFMRIDFLGAQPNGDGFSLDDMTIGVVPEPGSLLLLGLGSVAILARRRR